MVALTDSPLACWTFQSVGLNGFGKQPAQLSPSKGSRLLSISMWRLAIVPMATLLPLGLIVIFFVVVLLPLLGKSSLYDVPVLSAFVLTGYNAVRGLLACIITICVETTDEKIILEWRFLGYALRRKSCGIDEATVLVCQVIRRQVMPPVVARSAGQVVGLIVDDCAVALYSGEPERCESLISAIRQRVDVTVKRKCESQISGRFCWGILL